jgi:RNA methyltransferase, TrmH family
MSRHKSNFSRPDFQTTKREAPIRPPSPARHAELTNPRNPHIKQARALQQRKVRDETGLFVVEGIRHVGEAVEAKAQVEYICYAPELLESDFAYQLLEQQMAAGRHCYALAPEVFRSLAEKDNPQGILAVVRQSTAALADLHPGNFAWGVALVAPQDPGNLGTILRTIDAVGASGLLLLDGGADPAHPNAVRASMGAQFWLPVVSAAFADFAAWAKGHGYHLYGTSAHGSVDYRAVPAYARPCILLLGSEQKGLLPEQTAICEQLIRLPMQGRVSSLNLAVAAGVMLYQMGEPGQAGGRSSTN